MAMGSTFEDRSDLFAPPYIPGDPESDRANREWQARNRNMTYDLVDELRMPRMPAPPRTAANATEGLNTQSFGTDPWLQAGAAMVGLPDRNSPAGKVTENYAGGDPRGDVDPLALVALAQGGPYDIDARRAAIQARRDAIAKQLTDQQIAAAVAENAPAPGGGGGTGGLAGGGMAASDRGTSAGDMAVSGATPGSVTQQGFFANAVPNEPDPNNVFSSPPPAPSKNALRDEGEEESAPGFDEDAANQSIADMLAEAIANAPAAPTSPPGHVPGENDQDAIDQGHNDVVAAALAEAIANSPADAPGTPSSHNSGRSADVVSPSTTTAPDYSPGYSPGSVADFTGPPGSGGFAGKSGGVLGTQDQFGTYSPSDTNAVNTGAKGDKGGFTGLPGGNTFGAPVGQTLAEMGAPTSFGPIGPGSPAGRNATTGAPVATPADNPDTFVGPIDPDPAATFAANNAVTVSPFGRSKDDSSQVSMDKQAADKAALSQSTHAMTPSGGRNAVATALSEQGRGRAGIADFAPDISLSDMASLASMGLPAAPGVPASDFADFATGKSMDAAVAAASMNAPGESGPVSPGGAFSGWGGFDQSGGFTGGRGGPGQGPSEGAMAAQAAADVAATAAAANAAAISEGDAAPAGPGIGMTEGAMQAAADAAQAAADHAQDMADDASDPDSEAEAGFDTSDSDPGDSDPGDAGDASESGADTGDAGDGGDGDGGDGGGGDY